MKIINFTVKKILKALLAHDKDQTIRPAWKKVVAMKYKSRTTYEDKPKPPRFKVNETVKIMWNQRSKEQWFCKRHGNNIITNYSNLDKEFKIDSIHAKNFRFGKECKCTPPVLYYMMNIELFNDLFFNKTLGTGKITEVFEIEMLTNHEGEFCIAVHEDIWNKVKLDDLAKRDGFSSAEEMFKFFDEYYDLSISKKFYVYRWRWNK